MPTEIKLWKTDGGSLTEIDQKKLNLEERLQQWLVEDIDILSEDLLLIGEEIETDYGGYIDLLCLDTNGDLVVVELKRDKTPRQVTAQAIDYASWVQDLSNEQITELAEDYFNNTQSLEKRFEAKFGEDFPDVLNESHKILIVGSQIDPQTERIIGYLSENFGVNINQATFQYFKDEEGNELLGRVFLVEPDKVESRYQRKSGSKRRRNLTYEQLTNIAEEQGVFELYTRFLEGVREHFDFSPSTTKSTITFKANLDGSHLSVLRISPPKSSPEKGLKFVVYSYRLADYFNVAEDQIESMLPKNAGEWSYTSKSDQDMQGYEGYFTSEDQIDAFIRQLLELK